MAKLIQMRQRIQAIETIKKITHAMRLISMSAHSRLKHKRDPLTHYMQELSALFAKVQTSTPQWTNPIINPPEKLEPNRLIILVGSQKGLCGSFNALLFQFFAHHMQKLPPMKTTVIAIGKKAVDYTKEINQYPILNIYEKFTTRNLFTLAQEIITTITQAKPRYTSVLIFSNHFKSFFIQQPHVTELIPFISDKELQTDVQPPIEGYIWEQSPLELLDNLVMQYLEARIQYSLFQSLLSEHAARFLSMDNSTRNANNLLEATRLEFNKLRQAKITKELTELTGSFE